MNQALKDTKPSTLQFLRSRFSHVTDFAQANVLMLHTCGIQRFFPTQGDFLLFQDLLKPREQATESITRREYGDFQTPFELAQTVCRLLHSQGVAPTILIEPTFGKGSFVLAALEQFPTLRQIHGVEIYPSYCWSTKFSILEFFFDRPDLSHPTISFLQADVFKVEFANLIEDLPNENVLVLGNPPWITNSELSMLNSNNVPIKANFKLHNGLDAITGKGNFDIGEYIILMMFKAFARGNGSLAMLAKNSVIRNLLQDLPNTNYSIANIRALKFDAKLYFNASVEASLVTCDFGQESHQLTCKVCLLASLDSPINEFGWLEGKFVADVVQYKLVQQFDGSSPFVWRQGVKHDCSRVLELDFDNGTYKNGFNEVLDIEDDLVFPLVKSSDIQASPIALPRKSVIVTQKKVGEDTGYIAQSYPRLHAYLSKNISLFSNRKSSIYKGKSPFSIFGIGDYSFKPFKVAISGLYKKPRFALARPHNGKPVLFDDTCYFLGFDREEHSVIALLILSSEPTQRLLASIAFLDAKRPYTKDILMRIDLARLAIQTGIDNLRLYAESVHPYFAPSLTLENWNEFLNSFNSQLPPKPQFSLFGQPSSLPAGDISKVI